MNTRIASDGIVWITPATERMTVPQAGISGRRRFPAGSQTRIAAASEIADEREVLFKLNRAAARRRLSAHDLGVDPEFRRRGTRRRPGLPRDDIDLFTAAFMHGHQVGADLTLPAAEIAAKASGERAGEVGSVEPHAFIRWEEVQVVERAREVCKP